jgi:uncharacterized membrane protein YcjF (UPF0283 family)
LETKALLSLRRLCNIGKGSNFQHLHCNNNNIEEIEMQVDDDNDNDEVVDTTTTETEPIDRRDEVGEVRKMSSKDTNRLRLWRIIVTIVILLTAFAVTFTTYTLLEQQEDANFQTAVCSIIGWVYSLLPAPAIFIHVHELTNYCHS